MTSPAHPRVAAVARLLTEAGSVGEVRVLPDDVRTAAAAAQALGVPAGAIVNSLVFAVGEAPVLILTSGAHRVEENQVAALLGVERIAPARPDFVRRHTGQPIGGVAPIGHPQPIGTLVGDGPAAGTVTGTPASRRERTVVRPGQHRDA